MSPCLYLMQNGPTDHVGSYIQAFARNQVSEENNSLTLFIFFYKSCNSYQLIINSKLEFMFPLFAVTGTSDSETKSNEIQKSIGISFFDFV